MSVPYVISGTNIQIFTKDGETKSIGSDHPNYAKIKALVANTDTTIEEVLVELEIPSLFAEYSEGKLTFNEDERGKVTVKFDGFELPSSIQNRILATITENGSVESLVLFLENLFQNPSNRAVNELYGFLLACDLPITSDGCFLAYKKVRHDYGSLHKAPDGKHMDNSIGKTVSMPRHQVDDNPNRTCSTGLHCASFGYMSHYGSTGTKDLDDRLVIVKVNPKNVVSVPVDYNNQKMRVSEYLVIDEIPNDGITTVVGWTYGDRKENWIRDAITFLKDFVEETFDAKVTTTETFGYGVSAVVKFNFLCAIYEKFELQLTTVEDYLNDKGEFTIKSILQWISNYSE